MPPHIARHNLNNNRTCNTTDVSKLVQHFINPTVLDRINRITGSLSGFRNYPTNRCSSEVPTHRQSTQNVASLFSQNFSVIFFVILGYMQKSISDV
jgi:hypothetical protein